MARTQFTSAESSATTTFRGAPSETLGRPLARYTALLGAPDWPAGVAGSKADNLHRLMHAGFRVPDGFCVLAPAFDEVVDEWAPRVEDLAELRDRLAESPLNERLAGEIRAQMDALSKRSSQQGDTLAWAVRSSALAEDSMERSFAGQHQTILGLKTPDEVLAAIGQVWASLYHPDALLYRAHFEQGSSNHRHSKQAQPQNQAAPQNQAEPQNSAHLGSMAVLVQRMVPGDVSGVIFSSDPISGDPNQLVINAAPGLGETVVSGQAADTYYVDRQSGYILRHEAGEGSSEQALDAEQLRTLASCAREVAELFEGPQDIEWAFSTASPGEAALGIAPTLFILQSRPLTTYFEDYSEQQSQQNSRSSCDPQLWTNVNVGEALPGVATPLTWSIIHDFSRRGFERAFGALGLDVPPHDELVGAIRGRVYLNLSQFLSIASAIPLLKPETLFEMAGGSRIEADQGFYEKRASAKFLARLPLTACRVAASQLVTPLIAPLWARYLERRRDDFFAEDLAELSHAELGELFGQVERLFERTGLIMLQASSNFLMSFVLMREFLRLSGRQRPHQAQELEQTLMSALGVDSANPGYDLLRLGHIARRSLRLRQLIGEHPAGEVLAELEATRGHQDVDIFLAEFERFRHQHGHRAPREAELSTPRWREDPQFLFRVLKSYLNAPSLPDERALLSEQRAARAAIDAEVQQLFWPGVALGFHGLLRATRASARLREVTRARVVDTLDIYRRFFLECGRRLSRDGMLRRPDDVFYLELADILGWLNDPKSQNAGVGFARKALQTRALTDLFAAMPAPPDTLVRDPQNSAIYAYQNSPREFFGKNAADAAPPNNSEAINIRLDDSLTDGGDVLEILEGLPGSPGQVTGRARVVLDPNLDAHLQPGEILVAPWADIGWTPLFLSASGLVTGLGGPLSHACIVAREYGLPTVVNARGATERIQTGDLITLDAARGLVLIRERG